MGHELALQTTLQNETLPQRRPLAFLKPRRAARINKSLMKYIIPLTGIHKILLLQNSWAIRVWSALRIPSSCGSSIRSAELLGANISTERWRDKTSLFAKLLLILSPIALEEASQSLVCWNIVDDLLYAHSPRNNWRIICFLRTLRWPCSFVYTPKVKIPLSVDKDCRNFLYSEYRLVQGVVKSLKDLCSGTEHTDKRRPLWRLSEHWGEQTMDFFWLSHSGPFELLSSLLFIGSGRNNVNRLPVVLLGNWIWLRWPCFHGGYDPLDAKR